jgi:hypothetical protein
VHRGEDDLRARITQARRGRATGVTEHSHSSGLARRAVRGYAHLSGGVQKHVGRGLSTSILVAGDAEDDLGIRASGRKARRRRCRLIASTTQSSTVFRRHREPRGRNRRHQFLRGREAQPKEGLARGAEHFGAQANAIRSCWNRRTRCGASPETVLSSYAYAVLRKGTSVVVRTGRHGRRAAGAWPARLVAERFEWIC